LTSPALKQSPLPSPRRIKGLALRHLYLYMESWPRLMEMMYWPIINMIIFGFISLSIMKHFNNAYMVTDAYLAGLMLNEVLLRTVFAFMVMYMEEVWSRNLGHLFAGPLRMRDYIAGLVSIGTARCLISVVPAFILVFYMFDFSILRLGWYLPVYIGLLCFCGWWYGMMIMALLLRFGLAAEWLGWMCTWVLMPFMAPYYPVSILPKAVQIIAWCLPGTYVFESMKQQLADGHANPAYLVTALILNAVFFGLASFLLAGAFRSARKNGGLLQMGE